MQIAYGKTFITPDLPCKLGGYYANRVSSEILNELEARVLIFKERTVKVFISLDLVGVDEYFRDDLIKLLIFKIRKEDLVVSAIHTHSGPSGIFKEKALKGLEGMFGKYDKGIYYGILNKVALLVNETIENLDDFETFYGETRVEDEYSERNDLNNYFNKRIIAYKFVTSKDEYLLYQINCHPTILHEDNLKISSDLIYGINKYLDNQNSFPLNGTSGDVSTRFTRVTNGIEEVERIGKSLATKINQIEFSKVDNSLKIEEYPYSFKTFKNKKEYFSDLDPKILALVDLFNYLKDNDELKFTYQVIDFFGKKMITLPFEVLSSLAHDLVEDGVIVVSYTNAYYLYLADKIHYDKRHYEAIASLVSVNESESLIELLKGE